MLLSYSHSYSLIPTFSPPPLTPILSLHSHPNQSLIPPLSSQHQAHRVMPLIFQSGSNYLSPILLLYSLTLTPTLSFPLSHLHPHSHSVTPLSPQSVTYPRFLLSTRLTKYADIPIWFQLSLSHYITLLS